jgi:hypothetical protein
MLVAPGTLPDFGRKLTREAAQRVADNWWRLLVNGLALIVAGVLIFSINWSIRSLATFIGVLFIVEGVAYALTTGSMLESGKRMSSPDCSRSPRASSSSPGPVRGSSRWRSSSVRG